jgi:acyl dehydratase
MAKEFELTEEMKAQVGMETPTWTYEVTTTSVRAFARGVGYKDRIYYDVQAAQQAGYRNIPAPPTYLGTPVYIPGESSETLSEPKRLGFRIKHGLKNGVDGSTETEYFDTICAGDTLTAQNKLVDLQVRESKSLGKMLIIKIKTTFKNEENKIVAVRKAELIAY